MRKSPADFEEHWDYREPQPGDQLRVERTGYYHHGIYAGDGRVIHFNGGPDAHAADVEVQETDISEFLRGGLPEVRASSCASRTRFWLRRERRSAATATMCCATTASIFPTNAPSACTIPSRPTLSPTVKSWICTAAKEKANR